MIYDIIFDVSGLAAAHGHYPTYNLKKILAADSLQIAEMVIIDPISGCCGAKPDPRSRRISARPTGISEACKAPIV
jgi:hypothetical protein